MKPMREKLTIAILTAVFVLVPPPVKATPFPDSVFTTGGDSGQQLADLNLDKEKPSKREKKEKEEKVTGGEKETEGKKKFDDFKDKDKNGIDDRFEKPTKPGKEAPKKRKKDEPGEVNF
ncbi:MAG: hypothetical protein L0196_02840 [candidate division Zixibacteria bacterium]|nr:hypothetical protein [candidate division Zixibacteria bacterium]